MPFYNSDALKLYYEGHGQGFGVGERGEVPALIDEGSDSGAQNFRRVDSEMTAQRYSQPSTFAIAQRGWKCPLLASPTSATRHEFRLI